MQTQNQNRFPTLDLHSSHIEKTAVIRQALAALDPDPCRLELRILVSDNKGKHTDSGYYDDLDALAERAAYYDGCAHVYVTLNPPIADCLARSYNTISRFARETTTDAQIERRINFLIDFDPVRIAGVSATDPEKARAQAQAEACQEWLVASDWPEPLLADSGNGYHLVYRVDQPNDAQTTTFLHNVLNALSQRFSSDAVGVDRSVYNAARIVKLWGTQAIKGSNVPDRPHRWSHLISVPEARQAVTLAALEQVAATYSEPEKTSRASAGRKMSPPPAPGPRSTPRQSPGGVRSIRFHSASGGEHSGFDLMAWLEAHNVGVKCRVPNGDGTKLVLDACPFNSDHDNDSPALFQDADGKITFYCFHNSCQGKKWADMRQQYEPDYVPHIPYRPGRAASSPGADVLLSCLAEEHTDVGNRNRMLLHFGHLLRYCGAHKPSWMVWTGKVWKWDETDQASEMAIQTAAWIAQEETVIPQNLDEEGKDLDQRRRDAIREWSKQSNNGGRLAMMLKWASSDPLVRVTIEDMDADPWLFNAQNGVLDLRTGTLLDHDPARLITQIAPVAYDADAECPRWMAFLARMVPDATLRDYLQCAVGYMLTGLISEQSFWFLYGTGRNGKSTFIETVMALMGNYAGKIPSAVIMSKNTGQDTLPAMTTLLGKRLVVASELGEGQKLDEVMVKDISGGDTLQARFLYAHQFTFRPTAKLVIFGNHKPIIKGSDLGIWRRVRLLPFEEKLSPMQADPDMGAKLRSELAGILVWAVRGLAQWQAAGKLIAPQIVRSSVEDYRTDMDVLGHFLTDCCTTEAGANAYQIQATRLYQRYQQWCADGGERNVLPQRSFGLKLSERGFKKLHHRTGDYWTGITDKQESQNVPR